VGPTFPGQRPRFPIYKRGLNWAPIWEFLGAFLGGLSKGVVFAPA